MATQLGVSRPVLVDRNDVGLGVPVVVPTVAVARTSLRSVRATAYGGTATRRFAPRLLGPTGLESRVPASTAIAYLLSGDPRALDTLLYGDPPALDSLLDSDH